MKRTWNHYFVALVALVCAASPAWALKTVAKTGGDYSTIADALAAAAPGEEVRVIDQATYTEYLNINNGNLIVSSPAGATINSGANWNQFWGGTATLRGFTMEATSVLINTAISSGTLNLDNISFKTTSYALHLPKQVTLNITGCTFDGNWESIYIASDHESNSVINIADSTFKNVPGHVIDIIRPAKVSVTNSVITSTGNRGIQINETGPAGVYELTLNGTQVKNCGGDGVFVGQPATVALGPNTILNNNGGNGLDWQPTIDGGTLVATQVQFTGNANKGIYLANNLTSTLTQCTLSNNVDTGLVRYNENGPSVDTIITLANCTLANNGGYGIWAPSKTRAAQWTLNHNTFQANSVGGLALGNDAGLSNVKLSADGNKFFAVSGAAQPLAGLGYLTASSRFINNLVDGGDNGVVVSNGDLALLQNTFVNQIGSGVVLISGAHAVSLFNNIFAQGAVGISVETGLDISNVSLDYNLFNMTTASFDNMLSGQAGAHELFGLLPEFILSSTTIGGGNYQLQASSPAANAGTTGLGITRDIDGRIRPQGSAPEMGAYEIAGIAAAHREWTLY